ncbi:MAG: hypothetical protein HZA31_12850 [Opitutae bacterium]|nr:hypothetical protein [Opitutae bacterium]
MNSEIFEVAFVNLAPDARSASTSLGTSRSHLLEKAELTALLEAFRELDSVQNYEAEPYIEVEVKHGRYRIQTGQKKLFLYDTRHRDAPALTLSAAEIIAEIDGSAAAAQKLQFVSSHRAPVDQATPPAAPTVPEVRPAPPRRGRLLALVALACALGGGLAYMHWSPRDPAAPAPPRLIADPAEQASVRATVVGVYMTGSEPGHHGVAVMTDGTLKLFQLNRDLAPSMVYGRYQLGRREAKICLITDQPGGVMEMADAKTLLYCGETYKRIQ